MSNSLKYKIDTVELIAFIVGVLIMMGTYRMLFINGLYDDETMRMVITTAIVVLFSTLYGAVTGTLNGFFGVLCANAVTIGKFNFIDAFSFAVLGLIIGIFANKYLVREGQTKIKQIVGWNMVHLVALMSTFVFMVPFLKFLIFDVDLFDAVEKGMRIWLICAIPVGLSYSILFYLISILFRYVKCRS